MFVKLELGINPTFKEVFNSSKSCSVLTHFWETLISPQIAVVTENHDSVNTLIQHLLRGIPELNINKAFKTAALIMAGRSFGGLTELKTIVLSHRSTRTWFSLNKQIKEANFVLANLETNWWEQIEDQLETYEPLLLTQNL